MQHVKLALVQRVANVYNAKVGEQCQIQIRCVYVTTVHIATARDNIAKVLIYFYYKNAT